MLRFKPGDKLYLLSDGILESESPDGSMFGEQRLEQVIEQYSADDDTQFNRLIDSVHEYTQSDSQSDDYTIIEYTMDEDGHHASRERASKNARKQAPMSWRLEHEFRSCTLRNFDPLPLVLQILNESPGLQDFRGRVFTILAELYANALDHGVLGLDSSMKKSPEGFTQFYISKKERLANLTEGMITIRMEHLPNETGGELLIRVTDSGKGFDIDAIQTDKNEFSGRGLALIDSLCKDITFSNSGRQVDVTFEWNYS
jgi:signal transduction histidine kinase